MTNDNNPATYTCPDTGVTINADWVTGEHGSPNNGDPYALVSLVKREDEDTWRLIGDDVRQGDMTPSREWHNRDLVISLWQGNLAVIYDSDLPEILDALKPLSAQLRTIEDGHTIEWDGNNYVGGLDEDASKARGEIEFDGDMGVYGAGCTRIVETLQSYAAATQDAETWYWEYLRGLDADQLRDPDLADRLLQEAKVDEIRVSGDIQEAIDEAIADREDAGPTPAPG